MEQNRIKDLEAEIVRLDYKNPDNEVNYLKIKDKKIGDLGKIICFEPEPVNYGRIKALNSMYRDMEVKIDVSIEYDSYRVKELVEDELDQLKNFSIHFFNVEELMVLDLFANSDFKINSPFGDTNSVLTKDIIVNENLYTKAKEFNAYYNSVTNELLGWEDDGKSIEDQWASLNNIKKESSLYQSVHQATKKSLLDQLIERYEFPINRNELIKTWEDKIDGHSVSDQVDIIEEDPFMNFMSALEHKRWNNFYYMRDFVYGPEKNELKKNP